MSRTVIVGAKPAGDVLTAGTADGARSREVDASVVPVTPVPEFVPGQAQACGSKRALIEPGTGRALSYAQLAAVVRRAGRWLTAQDVLAGDVLALCAPITTIDFVVTWHAASSIGATVTTFDPLSTRQEMFRQLCCSGARWLVTTAELYVSKLEVAARPSAVKETFVIGAEPAGPRARRFDGLHLQA